MECKINEWMNEWSQMVNKDLKGNGSVLFEEIKLKKIGRNGY